MGAQWKREVVQDHKFDFINVDDFIDNSCWMQFRYTLVFVAIIRGILVYCSDIFTAANLLANSNENSFVPKTGVQLELFGKLPFDVYKYLFSGCIILGFLLLGLDIRRARAIIVSRDISYAFTSLIASRFYTVRSYPHYCFFAQINNSKKMVDEVAFFCFFTFRNWKRLMLADAPRQVINATILYQTFRGHPFNFKPDGVFDWDSVVTGANGDRLLLKKIALGGMIFTVFMFIISLLQLIIAAFLYIPLVSHIQGNLKEFCCHKIDKRIDELIRKKSKTRAADEAGKMNGIDMAEPTLPQLDVLEAPVETSRPAFPPKTPIQHPAQTPKSTYNYAQHPQKQFQPRQQQLQQQQQEYAYPPINAYNKNATQGGYDYYQAKPALSGGAPSKSREALDPYAESAYTANEIYDHYASEQDQRHLQQHVNQNRGQGQNRTQNQSGYGYTNPYPHVAAAGASANFHNNSANSSKRVSPAYNNPAPPRPRRYDEYGQPRPASPNQSHHGSDLESHHGSQHSSQVGHAYGAGAGAGASGGVGVGAYNNAAKYGNARYAPPRNSTATFGNEYQMNPRRQDTGQSRNGYNGGGY
ncbi:hypothetical protein BGX21_009928 [Mortierella sp. AD011]|nr:hypothetical protein BGX20_007114 [Mortierella sp. AD010]KAF9402485.1 hypothetical protein BGX21_009928 [Mortierella sp. AD011]